MNSASQVDDDVLITNSYETARRTAQNFLSVFLKKSDYVFLKLFFSRYMSVCDAWGTQGVFFCMLTHLRCGSKQAEEDYRPLFENFVQDLLSTVNKPEWPASELLLSLLGRLLVMTETKYFLQMKLSPSHTNPICCPFDPCALPTGASVQ